MIGDELVPEIEVACAVCGERDADLVCSAAELERQLAAAYSFHARRLRRAQRGRSSRGAMSGPAFEDRASFTHAYPTRLLACRSCGLLYRSPRPDAAAVLRAYRDERYSADRLLQMIVSQRALFRPKARALAAWLHPGARVLEVGCFVGGFLREAREAGLVAAGLDPSDQLAALCRRSGLRVVGSTLESLTEPARAERYDAVVIWNTFDQLPRPRSALAAALRVLQPGGMLILRAPHGRYFRERAGLGQGRGARSPGTTCSAFRTCTATASSPSIGSAPSSGSRARAPGATRSARSPTTATRPGRGSRSAR